MNYYVLLSGKRYKKYSPVNCRIGRSRVGGEPAANHSAYNVMTGISPRLGLPRLALSSSLAIFFLPQD